MRRPNPHIALLSLLLSESNAISAPKPTQEQPRVVQLALQRNHVEDPVAHDRRRLLRREGSVQVGLDNSQTLYFFNASIGTPAQDLRLHLDTGSSDLWVNTPNSELCESRGQVCQESGTYRANSSSTYEYLDSNFNITYVDGSGAAGDYVTDTLKFEDIEIPKFQFGIGYSSSSSQGILGIGYPANEVQAAHQGRKPYDNLPARLLGDGKVAANAYSIWLDNLNSTTGSLLFGGVDQSQYRGDLVTVPVQKSGPVYREFYITMTGLDVGSESLADDMAMAVLLDTGSSLTYLPTDLAKSIYDRTNVTWIEESQLAVASCNLRESNDNVTFHFSKPASISVAMKELVLPITAADGRQLRFINGNLACLFGIFPTNNGAKVLGDTFLRSAYVVYDMNNNEVSLAQSNFDAKPEGSNVMEIGTGKNPLPGAVKASNPVSAKSGLPAQSNATVRLLSVATYLMAAGSLTLSLYTAGEI